MAHDYCGKPGRTFEILRWQNLDGYYAVTQAVDADGPDEAAQQAADLGDGERFLVRFRSKGGVTPYVANVAIYVNVKRIEA